MARFTVDQNLQAGGGGFNINKAIGSLAGALDTGFTLFESVKSRVEAAGNNDRLADSTRIVETVTQVPPQPVSQSAFSVNPNLIIGVGGLALAGIVLVKILK